MPAVNNVGEPCAGEPHARFDGRGLETERDSVTAPVPDPTLTDQDSFIATEVFEDRAAMDREEAIPEVAALVKIMEAGALTGPPEWTIFDVASSESPSM